MRIINLSSGVCRLSRGPLLLLFFVIQCVAVRVGSADTSLSPETPPGRIIDLGTHSLHIHCVGENQPTVVIDAGVGGFSLEWQDIQNNLATQMRVCTYDRAGYGWSDSGPSPRTTAQIVEELYWLLEMADEQGPFILIGHSFGGYTMQRFAALYPELTAALVLVDSSHPDQHKEFPVLASTVGQRSEIPAQQARLMRRRIMLSSVVKLHENYPTQAASTAYQLMMFAKSMRVQQQELQFFRQSALDVIEAGHLPEVELVILSRGLNAWPDDTEGLRKERAWQALQQRFLRSNHHAHQIIAQRSRHHIHLDQPQLLENVIRGLVTRTCEKQVVVMLEKADSPREC